MRRHRQVRQETQNTHAFSCAHKVASRESVSFTRAGTHQIPFQNFAGCRHPTDPARRIAGHQRKGRHILVTTAPAPIKAYSGDRIPQTIVALAPMATPCPIRVFSNASLRDNMRTRITHIGKDGIRPDENVVGNLQSVIQADIILDCHAVADRDTALDKDVMRELAIAPDARAFQDDAMLPEPCAVADRQPPAKCPRTDAR